MPKYGVFSGPYFPAFGLNTVRYSASLHLQSKCRKIRTRKNFVIGHFSRSNSLRKYAYKKVMRSSGRVLRIFWQNLIFYRITDNCSTIRLPHGRLTKIGLFSIVKHAQAALYDITLMYQEKFQSLDLYPEADLGLLQHPRWSALW